MPGRLCTKRKRASNEPNGPRSGTRKCTKCFKFGHNIRTCPYVQRQAPPKVSRPLGRPKIVDQSRTDSGLGRGGSGGMGRGGRSGMGRGGLGRSGPRGGLVDIEVEDVTDLAKDNENEQCSSMGQIPVEVNNAEDVTDWDAEIDEYVANLGKKPVEERAEGPNVEEIDEMIHAKKPKVSKVASASSIGHFVPPRKKSERILKLKLAKTVETADGKGLVEENPVVLE